MKKLFSAALLGAFAFGVVSGPALYAADKPKPSVEDRFKKLDADSNGKVTKEEFVAKAKAERKDQAEKRFGRLDKDSDGNLTLEEFKAGQKKTAE